MGSLGGAANSVEQILANGLLMSFDVLDTLVKIVGGTRPTDVVTKAIGKLKKPIHKAMREFFRSLKAIAESFKGGEGADPKNPKISKCPHALCAEDQKY